jgi:hypothetical protein
MAKTIGVDWVNNYHGRADDLKNCDNDAEGFYNKLSGVKTFDWGDDNAWDTDFEQSGVGSPSAGGDTAYADNVTIVYFAGHGWIYFGVTTHDNGTAGPSEMSLGDKNCRYLALSTCSAMSDAGTARWKPIFKGLRAMFGFKTTIGDSGSRGEKFANYLNAGYWMDTAWELACQETEDGSCEWGYLHVSSPVNSWIDKWTDPTAAAIANPTTLCFHSGSC